MEQKNESVLDIRKELEDSPSAFGKNERFDYERRKNMSL